MTISWMNWTLLAWASVASGCASHSFLEQATAPERPKYSGQVIAVPPAPLPHVDIVNSDPTGMGGPAMIDDIRGTWIFTTPATVTRVERKNADIDQFSLYVGRPEPADTPFLVITVTPDRQSLTESDPTTYKISDQREYVLNGNVVHEWTGLAKSGASFSELIIRKPGVQGLRGDICHALAVARNINEQQLALSILGSITWKPVQ